MQAPSAVAVVPAAEVAAAHHLLEAEAAAVHPEAAAAVPEQQCWQRLEAVPSQLRRQQIPHLLQSSTPLGHFPRARCPPRSAGRCPAGHRGRPPAPLVPERASGLVAGRASTRTNAACRRRVPQSVRRGGKDGDPKLRSRAPEGQRNDDLLNNQVSARFGSIQATCC